MPHVATSPADLMTTIGAAAHLDGDRLVIDDEKAFRESAIRDLAWTAAFAEDDATFDGMPGSKEYPSRAMSRNQKLSHCASPVT